MYDTPYIAVIFTSIRSSDLEGYREMDERTFSEVSSMEGFLGSESFDNSEGKHVTIAYFKNEQSVQAWKEHPIHQEAQARGKSKWYDHYNLKVCHVFREYEFNKAEKNE